MTKSKTKVLSTPPVPVELIQRSIYLIRGRKVMLDSDLAALYQVPTKAFNQTVKRNLERFPPDFMFQLTAAELQNWRSQFVTSNPSAKMGLRRPPYAFTEHGVAMLSSVQSSQRAIHVNIAIIRAFAQLRDLVSNTTALAHQFDQLESYVFRRSVCNLQTRSLNQIFASLANRIQEEQPLTSLQVALYRQSKKRRFPTDNEFREALETRDVYDMRNCFYLLERMENFSKERIDTHTFTIEHVLPQNEDLRPEWRTMLGSDWNIRDDSEIPSAVNVARQAYESIAG